MKQILRYGRIMLDVMCLGAMYFFYPALSYIIIVIVIIIILIAIAVSITIVMTNILIIITIILMILQINNSGDKK